MTQIFESCGVWVGTFLVLKLACYRLLRDYTERVQKGQNMSRYIRILAATPLYLLASVILLVSLKIYPADLRDEAKDSFL